MKDSFIITLISGLALLFLILYNKDHKIEHFLTERNKHLYKVFKLAYSIIFVSFVVNVRYIIYSYVVKHQ
jgi:hypothetical protein